MYFEQAGIANTEKTLEVAFRYARDNQVKHIVVASTTGHTARMLLDRFPYAAFHHRGGHPQYGIQGPGRAGVSG